MTNCRNCNYSCHYPCEVKDNNLKNDCGAMLDGKCYVCKNKCGWEDHCNMSFFYETKWVKEKGKAD